MYFRGMFSLDEWDERVLYIVFDDCKLQYIPDWKFFLGAHKEGIRTDKYRGKRNIKNAKPCLWVCNPEDDPRLGVNDDELDWLKRNCLFIRVTFRLF